VNPRRVVVRAPAKVNLTLGVLGRRPDGFHEVDTVLIALTLADRLVLQRRAEPGVSLRVTGPAAAGVPADGTNLAVRAAEGLLGGSAGGLELELEKHVPAGGGLGGGSSDAAASVLGVATLLGLDPDGGAAHALLAELGSDCAFFLAARATGLARCTGRGERVEPWEGVSFPWWLVLVAPPFGCATGEVYRAFRGREGDAPALARTDLAGGSRATLEKRLVNDLLPAARASHPALAAFERWLEGHGPGRFRLSGSGSSWFALCADEAEARALAGSLAADAKARHHALRGPWVTRAAGQGVARDF